MRFSVLRLVALAVCVVAVAGFTAAAACFSGQAHARSGIPSNHYAVREGDDYYYRPTGGPARLRPRYPITREQYLAFESSRERASEAAGRAALFAIPMVILFIPTAVRLSRARASATAARGA